MNLVEGSRDKVLYRAAEGTEIVHSGEQEAEGSLCWIVKLPERTF